MDLSGLVVESIEVVPAGSLDSAAYGHGLPELAASCELCLGGFCDTNRAPSGFLPEDWD